MEELTSLTKTVKGERYVRILFKPHGAKRARWYWAAQASPESFRHLNKCGEDITPIANRKGGGTLQTLSFLIGAPQKIIPAKLVLRYGELEVR